ncbi:cysteine hydrolase family protein [Aquibacillus koreensis]|uniref:Cysteine hydrolase family protein n=1 Tax=Aquibacillus koreensis TaxID=279446 RepID=A0A9X3WNN4_9BACI|nr:cysteine hydrolase family protein [Aquibacillus koreensis]MCT2534901.1 cysteine hydrolase family protein [Aquibacillus koreensis]MDC3422205.1 cysteine hydrolase family protein [Aquibacillus koreensis]
MIKRALINIDYTYDFVADDGKLTCGEAGQAIENEVVAITKQFVDAEDFVVFAIDGHDEGDTFHPETSLFPPHNIKGTKGRTLYGELQGLYEKIKYLPQVNYMDKTRYSAFAGTDLEMKLRERGINEIYLVGVCTDICVLHTAIDAYNKGFDLYIYQNAVASFNQAGHDWALGHFANTLGAKVL